MKSSMIKAVEKGQLGVIIEKLKLNNFLDLNSPNKLNFGFVGELLCEKLKNEWLLSNLYYTDEPSMKFKCLTGLDDIKDGFISAKRLIDKLPFSFVEVCSQSNSNTEIKDVQDNDMSSLFRAANSTLLRKIFFCAPVEGITMFHQQQRVRKIWWRKFSSLPSRFSITEIMRSEDSNCAYVDIQAEFPWGLETVETIKHMPSMLTNHPESHEFKLDKKNIPHVVVSETYLEKAAMTYLCDACDSLNEATSKELMRFHRKLAPYEYAFAASGQSADARINVQELAIVLARDLKKHKKSTLLLPDVCRRSLEFQYKRNDALGIPYTVVLNDQTLQDGILSIRSRDTGLKEASHVSKVVDYLVDLMKNY